MQKNERVEEKWSKAACVRFKASQNIFSRCDIGLSQSGTQQENNFKDYWKLFTGINMSEFTNTSKSQGWVPCCLQGLLDSL